MEARITPGTVIDGDLEVARLLASGASASVYLANHLTMKKEVALKVLHLERSEDEGSLQRFKREAITIAKLAHPNIVTIYRTGIWDSRPFIAMEFIEGESLATRLSRGPLSVQDALPIFQDICNALSHAHSQGVIHRDIKPSNIMLCSENKVAKLADFGIAKLVSEAGSAQQKLTRTGEIFGTLAYMSPEQLENKPADERSDIYSLACLVYETLSGAPPFSGESFQVLHKHLKEQAKPISSIPEDLNRVLLSALSKDPRDRPQSAAEFRDALLNPKSFAGRAGRRGGSSISKTLIVPLTLMSVILIAGLAFLAKSLSTKSLNNGSLDSSTSLTVSGGDAGLGTGVASRFGANRNGKGNRNTHSGAGSDSKWGAGFNAGSDSGSDSGSDPGAGAGSDSGSDSGSGAGSDSDSDPGSNFHSNSRGESNPSGDQNPNSGAGAYDSLTLKELLHKLESQKTHRNKAIILHNIVRKLENDKSGRIPRNNRLMLLSKYADELDKHHMTLTSTRIRKKVIKDVMDNGFPPQVSGSGHFGKTVLSEVQANLIRSLMNMRIFPEAKYQLNEMVKLQPADSLHLLDAALVVRDEALIQKCLESVRTDDAIAGRVAHLLLINNRLDQLKSYIAKTNAAETTSRGREYSYPLSFLLLTKAQLLISEGKTAEARKIIKDLNLASSNYDSEDKRSKRLSMAIELLAGMREFKEAEKLIQILNPPDAPKVVPSESVSEKKLEVALKASLVNGNDKETLNFTDGMLGTKITPLWRTILLQTRARKSKTDEVSAYFFARAYDESLKVPGARGMQLKCHYDYARIFEESGWLGQALKEYKAILTEIEKHGKPKTDYSEVDLLTVKGRIIKVCVALGDLDTVRLMGVPRQKHLDPEIPVHRFVVGRIALGDDIGALDLVQRCNNVVELAYCAETMLDTGRLHILDSCTERVNAIASKVTDSETRIRTVKYMAVLSAIGKLENENTDEARRCLIAIMPLGLAAEDDSIKERFELAAELSALRTSK